VDNSSYRSQYIQSGNENFSEQSVSVYDAFWKRLEKAERSIGKSLEDGYTTEEYAILIGKMNVSNLNAFATYKSRVNRYIKWLNERGLIDQPYLDNLKNVTYDMIPSNHVYDTRYFKDFSSLQQSISDTIWVAERIDDRIFSTQITAIYLAWCGFSAEEAVAMKKAEVLDDCIEFQGRRYFPNKTIMDYIKEYRDSTSYESQGRGVITLKYVYSDFLLRTCRADRVDTKTLRILIRNFGKSGGEEINLFAYDKVYWSGIFNRAYTYELENGEIQSGDIETIERVFHQTYPSVSVANKKLRDYHKFREYFFPDTKG
jgi:hypothetical protein